MLNERIIFLDLETTGGSLAEDRIIEIGLVEVDRGRLIGEWSTLINPERYVPHAIQVLTGITPEMLAHAPRFDTVADELAARLAGKIMAAHNARFDYGFLRHAFARTGRRFDARVLCTVKLSRRLHPEHPRHNLDALIMRHALFCLDRHRALADARVLWEVAQQWERQFGTDALSQACAELLRAPALPAGLAPDMIDDLPEAPGVYVLYGNGEQPLFAGKARNIRSRVIAHFTGGGSSGKDARLAQETTRVDYVEASGELGAQLRHAQLVRDLAPVYNRSPGEITQPCAWHWGPEHPERPPVLVTTEDVVSMNMEDVYGAFSSPSGARQALRGIADAYALCHTLVGLEDGSLAGGCSRYRLERCRGACVGRESVLSHALRMTQALSRLRMRRWPYVGAIAIVERDPIRERAEFHAIDRWRYLGSAATEADVYDLLDARATIPFDIGIYRTLARLLRPASGPLEIVPFPGPATRACPSP